MRLVGVLLALTALVFALVALDLTQPVDDAFLDLMVAVRVDPLVWVSKVLSKVGGVWVNWPLRVAALLALLWKRRLLQSAAFGLAVVSSELLIGWTKALYDRPRPLDALVGTSGASFPSGHAIAGAVTAVGLVVVLLPPGRARWAWELRAAAFATAMSLSRTYLGAHWLTDVVAGGLLGTSLAVGWPALLQEIRTRVHRRQLAALR